ncbi:MAG TPA: BlaI/MecI/CopY family transcriptional regulator [Vicinamibacterales bacterium]|jgi:predicted transcriptional regulator|nr:BlaI/MecI/CopY family transcriptional regulator [Vicinamibacterales bacterium]
MPKLPTPALSRREREIMDILHRRGRATVHEVVAELSGNTVYSTVRAQLRVLEDKGHLRHTEEQLRYVYMPAVSRTSVRRSALKHLLNTFFDGSPGQVVEALIRDDPAAISDEELEQMARLVQDARKGRRK